MKSIVVTSIMAIFTVAAADSAPKMIMGDGTVRGDRLRDYQHTWQQCSYQDGAWTAAPQLNEELTVIGEVLRHRQIFEQGNGVLIQSTTYFGRSSLAPLRMEQRVTGPDGSLLAKVSRRLDSDGYSGEAEKSGQQTQLKGKITSQMWHGAALGLPLATIDQKRFPVEFASSMMSFDGTYRTVATLAGHEKLKVGDREVDALMVDVEWHHHETGDVYPAGPDGSGGRYWLVSDPPEGVPYVPQYQTDSYLVSALTDACPR